MNIGSLVTSIMLLSGQKIREKQPADHKLSSGNSETFGCISSNRRSYDNFYECLNATS